METPRGILRPTDSPSASAELLQRARAGDGGALNRLFSRYLPQLQRWAHRRVPDWARVAADTSDLVQDTLLHTLNNLDRFEPREKGALLRYLRRGLLNRVRDQVRNAARHPCAGVVDNGFADPSDSPLDITMSRLQRERYLAALGRLRAADRAAIVSRVELGCSYEDLMVVLASPNPQAARQFVRRALLRLAAEMRRG